MTGHPYANAWPLLGEDELRELADDERVELAGGSATEYLQVSVWRDETHAEYFHVSVFSGGINSFTKRPVRGDFVPAQLRSLIHDADADLIPLTRASIVKKYRRPEQHNVYFVRDSLGNIKIGYARDVTSRLGALQTANSQPLVLLGTMPGTIADEKSLHARFSDAHIRGEWFKPNAALLAFIREVSA